MRIFIVVSFDKNIKIKKIIILLRFEKKRIKFKIIYPIVFNKGNLDRSILLYEQSLPIFKELNNKFMMAKDKQINRWYLFDKALILKKSLRARNRVKAEDILMQIVKDEDPDYELIVRVLLYLCELLLVELRMTNDLEVLDEIEPFVFRLINIAEKSNSYWILCEAHLLQTKLSLLTFNLKKAQRFLTQAQQIAERFGLTQLTTRIANEKEELLNKLDLWGKLKEVGSPMADRFDLTRLDEQIAGMVKNRAVLTAQVTEDKVAIHKEKKICLVCRGEVLRYTYICECGAIYCENCARAITDLENVCWACEVPIDYSKPVKPYKDEEEIVEMGKKSKKKYPS